MAIPLYVCAAILLPLSLLFSLSAPRYGFATFTPYLWHCGAMVLCGLLGTYVPRARRFFLGVGYLLMSLLLVTLYRAGDVIPGGDDGTGFRYVAFVGLPTLLAVPVGLVCFIVILLGGSSKPKSQPDDAAPPDGEEKP